MDLLFAKGLLKQPSDDGKVAALIVRGEQDGVFVLGCHCENAGKPMFEYVLLDRSARLLIYPTEDMYER